jgi:hypothetical protein
VIVAGLFRLNENVVPTGGSFLFFPRLICASLLPSRQADADCIRAEIDSGSEEFCEIDCVAVSLTNVAVTVWSELIGTLHAPAPLHAPLQPANVEPAVAAALNATVCDAPKIPEQFPGREIPVSLTEPERVPANDTLNS